jgi:hypothetical protein
VGVKTVGHRAIGGSNPPGPIQKLHESEPAVVGNRKYSNSHGYMLSKHNEQLLNIVPGIDVLLGVVSIPFTLALTTDRSTLTITTVLVSGFVCGLYYRTRSKSVRWAGIRTGLVGGLPVVWSVADLLSSAISASPDSLPIAIAGGSLLLVFFLTVSAILTLFCAMFGSWVSRKFSWI